MVSRAPRFFVEFPLPGTGETPTVRLSDTDAHHARTVLRIATGDAVSIVLLPDGVGFSATVQSLHPDLTVQLLEAETEQLAAARVNAQVVTVLVPLLKGDRNDLLTDYLTELGVKEMIFWQASRSIVRLKSSDLPKRQERWRRIAEAAAKQSGKNFIPRVEVALDLESALWLVNASSPGTRVVCSLGENAIPMRELKKMHPGPYSIVVGPEGDFVELEEQLLRARGWLPCSLGTDVLRAELALLSAVVAVTV
jgi:16S rRNA (uracil1498-N3)-methyltransferase